MSPEPSHRPSELDTDPASRLETCLTIPVIRGSCAEVNRAFHKILEESHVLASALRAGRDTISTLNLVPIRSGTPDIVTRGEELRIEFTARMGETRSSVGAIARSILGYAVLESSITAIKHFVRECKLAQGDLDQLALFAQSYAQAAKIDATDIRSIIRGVLNREAERLGRREEQLLKGLKNRSMKCVRSIEEAKAQIDSMYDGCHQALALIKLRELVAPSAKTRQSTTPAADGAVEKIEGYVDTLAQSVRALWPSALFSGDRSEAEQVMDLLRDLLSKFKAEGFSRQIPEPFSPERPRPISLLADFTHQKIDHDLFGASPLVAARAASRRFSPLSFSEIRSFVTCAPKILDRDQEIRAWSTSDPDPSGFLHERLLDVAPDVPGAMKELITNAPPALPAAIVEFVESVCLLRFHGDPEGLMQFGTLACQLTEAEHDTLKRLHLQKARATQEGDPEQVRSVSEQLHAYVAKLPAHHPADYSELIELLAAWPMLHGAWQGDVEYSMAFRRVSALNSSVLSIITKSLEASFCAVVKQEAAVTGPTLLQFRSDLERLGNAARASGHKVLMEFVSPMTAILLDLVNALEVDTMPLPQRLSQLSVVEDICARSTARVSAQEPSTSESTATIVATYVQQLLDEMRTALIAYAADLPNKLRETDSGGDTCQLVEQLTEALNVVNGCRDSSICDQIANDVDHVALSWANVIGRSLLTSLESFEQKLTNTEDPYPLFCEAVSDLKWHIDEVTKLRALFQSTPAKNGPARINHIDHIISDARGRLAESIVANQPAFRGFLRRLLQDLKNHPSEVDTAIATEIRSLPLAARRLTQPDAWKAFESLKARI